MSLLGTEYKIRLNATPVDNYHLGVCVDKTNYATPPKEGEDEDNYDFEVWVYVTPNRAVKYDNKNDYNKIKPISIESTEGDKYERDSCLIIIDSTDAATIGRGRVTVRLIAHIPDTDYQNDGTRTEIVEAVTNIIIT